MIFLKLNLPLPDKETSLFVFDLDHTLIHQQDVQLEEECKSYFVLPQDKEHCTRVAIRPGALEVLTKCRSMPNVQVWIWTLAYYTRVYQILHNVLDPTHSLIEGVVARGDKGFMAMHYQSKQATWVPIDPTVHHSNDFVQSLGKMQAENVATSLKDLALFGIPVGQIVHVDDSPLTAFLYPNQLIPVTSFYYPFHRPVTTRKRKTYVEYEFTQLLLPLLEQFHQSKKPTDEAFAHAMGIDVIQEILLEKQKQKPFPFHCDRTPILYSFIKPLVWNRAPLTREIIVFFMSFFQNRVWYFDTILEHRISVLYHRELLE